MPKYLLSVAAILAITTTFGQAYKQLVSQGDSLYNAKDYKKSNQLYQQAFKLEKKNPNDLYNAACSAAMAGDNKNAFESLESAFQNGWLDIDHLKKDTDLDGLHQNKKWTEIINKMQSKVDSIEANYDKPIQQELLKILEDDQGARVKYIEVTKKQDTTTPQLTVW